MALRPVPSAALYVRADLLDTLDVSWTGSNATKGGSVTMGVEDLVWIDGAKRFEYGGRTFSYDTAMAAGIEYISKLGLPAIEEHAQHLQKRLQEGLKTIPGAGLHSPTDSCLATGIATVSLGNMDGKQLSAALRDRYQIIQRPALRATTVRISLAAFIEDDDVDTLLSALTTLAKE